MVWFIWVYLNLITNISELLKCPSICVLNCVSFQLLTANCLEMGQFWHDLFDCEFLSLCLNRLNYWDISAICVHSTLIPCQTSLLCILNAVCIWLDANHHTWWMRVCVNECQWMRILSTVFTMWWMWWPVWMVWMIGCDCKWG